MSGTLATSSSLPKGRTDTWLERLLDLVEGSHARACGLLLLLSLVCFLPGFVSLQPMDRDEPRFAQASRQMVETGDYVDIRFQDEPRYKKPIGIHWLQVASVKTAEAFGLPGAREIIALYRIPSLIGALASVLLTYWMALAFGGRREAFLVAALMASSLILMVEARLAKTDAMLLACCVAAMGALARVWFARSLPTQPRLTLVVFWVAMAVGILIKGPMVVMFVGLAAVTLSVRERSPRWLGALRPGWGLLFVALAVMPWFLAIAWKSGFAFYRLAVGDDMLGKVATGQQNHFAPPGFYILAYWATFWPGAILAVAAIPLAWAERREDWVAFLVAWTLPAWILFEAVPTKLPHYVMPLYPAFAVLAVIGIARGFTGPDRPFARAGFGAMALIPVGLAVGLCFATYSLDRALPIAALPIMLVSCGLVALAWLAFNRGEVLRSAVLGIGSAAIMGAAVFGLGQPVLQSLRLSSRIADTARSASCTHPVFGSLGYREPSLVFLLGTSLDLVETTADAKAFLARTGCRVLIVDDRMLPAFRTLMGEGFPSLDSLGHIKGFNINGGRRQDLGAYRVQN